MSIYMEYKRLIEKESNPNNLPGLIFNATEEATISTRQMDKLIEIASIREDYLNYVIEGAVL